MATKPTGKVVQQQQRQQQQVYDHDLQAKIAQNEEEIAYREKASVDILTQMKDIQDLMLELDKIAKFQQPLIDSIEANIDKVDAHVGDAVVELREARANQKTCIIS